VKILTGQDNQMIGDFKTLNVGCQQVLQNQIGSRWCKWRWYPASWTSGVPSTIWVAAG